MRAFRRAFTLPLLTKELAERATRPRTYWMRVASALLLFLCFWADNRYYLSADLQPSAVLGSGQQMFQSLIGMLYIGIYTFVPAMLCGVVTQEKERDSLSLLLLTELRPWQIVLQKYIAGLVPALSLLLVALPLGGVAYTYGGFSADRLVFDLFLLFLATLQIGALALWASCRFRTTVAAFLGTYSIAFLFTLIPLLPELSNTDYGWITREVRPYLAIHIPPYIFGNATNPALHLPGIIAIAGTTLLFLGLAIFDLPRRAFRPARPILRLTFAWIDRRMQALNRWFGSVSFFNRSAASPDEYPIIWRERRSRGLARPEYLVRLLVLIEIPTLIIASMSATPGWARQTEGLSLLAAAVGVIAILVVAVASANVFVSERVNQTMEVLLTTALSPQEIVRQKAYALRRLVLIMAIPVASVFLIEGLVENTAPWTGYGETLNLQRPIDRLIPYWLISIGSAFLGLSVVAWIGLWIGLRSRTRIRAICGTLATIIGWCAAPAIIGAFIEQWLSRQEEAFLYVLSPLMVPIVNEIGQLHEMPLLALIQYFVVLGGALALFRRATFRRSDYWLRR